MLDIREDKREKAPKIEKEDFRPSPAAERIGIKKDNPIMISAKENLPKILESYRNGQCSIGDPLKIEESRAETLIVVSSFLDINSLKPDLQRELIPVLSEAIAEIGMKGIGSIGDYPSRYREMFKTFSGVQPNLNKFSKEEIVVDNFKDSLKNNFSQFDYPIKELNNKTIIDEAMPVFIEKMLDKYESDRQSRLDVEEKLAPIYEQLTRYSPENGPYIYGNAVKKVMEEYAKEALSSLSPQYPRHMRRNLIEGFQATATDLCDMFNAPLITFDVPERVPVSEDSRNQKSLTTYVQELGNINETPIVGRIIKEINTAVEAETMKNSFSVA